MARLPPPANEKDQEPLTGHTGHILVLVSALGTLALVLAVRRRAFKFQHAAAVLALLPVFHSHLEPLPGPSAAPPICCVLAQSVEPEVAFAPEARAVQFTLPVQAPASMAAAFKAGPRSIRSPPQGDGRPAPAS